MTCSSLASDQEKTTPHIIMLRTCEKVMLHGKRKFRLQVQLRLLVS